MGDVQQIDWLAKTEKWLRSSKAIHDDPSCVIKFVEGKPRISQKLATMLQGGRDYVKINAEMWASEKDECVKCGGDQYLQPCPECGAGALPPKGGTNE